LVAHRMRSTGYKKRDQTEERRESVAALRTKLTIGESVPDLMTSADLVHAAVCVLAGADFISGRAMAPEDRTLAEGERWIWTAPRTPNSAIGTSERYVFSVLRKCPGGCDNVRLYRKNRTFSGFFEPVPDIFW
ncbi:MAG TPA: hypothetical protein VIM04_08320, partial [Candidatus Binatia bacterium]